jgi:hypothetical protein
MFNIKKKEEVVEPVKAIGPTTKLNHRYNDYVTNRMAKQSILGHTVFR